MVKKFFRISSRSFIDDDYEFVNITTTWSGKDHPDDVSTSSTTEVMWSSQSMYGVIGSKVGDFVECYGVNSSLQEGLFTHRNIYQQLSQQFSGISVNELVWKSNPLELTLNSGAPRKKKAKWLPEYEPDLVHIYSKEYISIDELSSVSTNFFTLNLDKYRWLLCDEESANQLKLLQFNNLLIKEFSSE